MNQTPRLDRGMRGGAHDRGYERSVTTIRLFGCSSRPTSRLFASCAECPPPLVRRSLDSRPRPRLRAGRRDCQGSRGLAGSPAWRRVATGCDGQGWHRVGLIGSRRQHRRGTARRDRVLPQPIRDRSLVRSPRPAAPTAHLPRRAHRRATAGGCIRPARRGARAQRDQHGQPCCYIQPACSRASRRKAPRASPAPAARPLPGAVPSDTLVTRRSTCGSMRQAAHLTCRCGQALGRHPTRVFIPGRVRRAPFSTSPVQHHSTTPRGESAATRRYQPHLLAAADRAEWRRLSYQRAHARLVHAENRGQEVGAALALARSLARLEIVVGLIPGISVDASAGGCVRLGEVRSADPRYILLSPYS